MSLDFSKLTDAVAKVTALAASHADVSAAVTAANSARDAALADIAQAQVEIDTMAAHLIAAASTPAEAAGLAAVAAAVSVPPALPAAPVAPANPLVIPSDTFVAAPGAPVAPPAPTIFAPAPAGTTFLPGDPRANA